ncbi:MAG: hypothetical protein OK422_01560 [Thaumarchaeota archaeon]|nr:hypothetical protein [Nitrososphaerota archaeon]
MANTPATSSPLQTPPPLGEGKKNAWASALLNLFFPGLGYVYNGVDRDTGQMIFGVFVFISFFIGFEVAISAIALTTTGVTRAPTSPYAGLIILIYLLPIGLAYDGYHRANSA